MPTVTQAKVTKPVMPAPTINHKVVSVIAQKPWATVTEGLEPSVYYLGASVYDPDGPVHQAYPVRMALGSVYQFKTDVRISYDPAHVRLMFSTPIGIAGRGYTLQSAWLDQDKLVHVMLHNVSASGYAIDNGTPIVGVSFLPVDPDIKVVMSN